MLFPPVKNINMSPAALQSRTKHLFRHVDQHGHIEHGTQCRPRSLSEKEIVAFHDDDRHLRCDHACARTRDFKVAVEDRHRNEGFVPRPKAAERVEQSANVERFGRALARTETGRNEVLVVVMIPVHRKDRRRSLLAVVQGGAQPFGDG